LPGKKRKVFYDKGLDFDELVDDDGEEDIVQYEDDSDHDENLSDDGKEVK